MPSAALERHPATACAALRGIKASVLRTAQTLEVSYVLEGDIGRLRIPPPRPPRAAERLWQHTCCELFLARDGAPGYREFNLSPSGEWAAYAFARYRERVQMDEAPDPRISVRRAAGELELKASIAFPYREKLRVGLSAVIEEESGALSGAFSYWALRHPPGKPDFHHPDAFALELDEARH
jgi:hypothetical protein